MADSSLSVFVFESKDVRIGGTPEKPEWVAEDVARILEIKNVRQNLALFDDDEKGVCSIYTPGGKQDLLTVTEPGLYRLIFKSRKPIAKKFQRWVFHEVLPQIRKTGGYSIQEKDPAIAIYETHQKQCHQQFLLDTHRVELRNQLKTYRKGLNSTIKQHFEELGRKVPRDVYWKVADGLNVALTSETAKQMRKRTGLESHQLLADYMAERPLWFYSLAITVTTNLILHEDVEPLIAVAKAPSLSLPKDFFAEPVEIVDPIKALEKRIDLYLSGQLSLPVMNGKMLAIA